MARDKGLLGLSGNFEPQAASPLDARATAETRSDLTLESTWQALDGETYTYVGMAVVVTNDPLPANNGMYILSNTDYTNDGNWTKLGDGGGTGGGDTNYSITTDLEVGNVKAGDTISGTTLQTFLNQLFLQYDPASLTFNASVASGYREFGNPITSINLTSVPSKGDNDIMTLDISTSRDGIVATQDPIVPTGAPLVYNTLTQDTGNIVNDITISSSVSDGTTTATRNISYDFVFPFYQGWVDDGTDIFDGITQAQLLSLGNVYKNIKGKSNSTIQTSPVNGRFLIGYPSSYGNLTTIIDNTGFNTISDYEIKNISVIGLDSTLQSYRFYILLADTTQTNFNNSFNF